MKTKRHSVHLTPPKTYIWWLWTWIHWIQRYIQETSLTGFELCDVFLTCLNNVPIKGLKSAKKMSPSSLHHHHQPEPLIQERTNPAFHAVDTNFCPHHLIVTAEIETHQIDIIYFFCKPQRWQCGKLGPAHLVPNSLKPPVFPILLLGLRFSWSSWPCLNA